MEKVMQDLVTKHNFISERLYQLYVFVFMALLFIVNNVIEKHLKFKIVFYLPSPNNIIIR